MKLFFCDQCRQPIHFENTTCLNCEATLAFLPHHGRMAALQKVNDREWVVFGTAGQEQSPRYRLCEHYTSTSLCNWAIDAEDPQPLCHSCRLSVVIPNLSLPGRPALLYQMETGKRRLLFNLMSMGLPVLSGETHLPLSFSFLEDPDNPDEPRVLTGHDHGHITINLAEADDLHRHRSQAEMGEAYRTVLGHFRHEIGHFYWDLFIGPSEPEGDAASGQTPELLHRFRELFGDERQDYGEALKRHYDAPRQDWAVEYISQYASSHPWEDWAETWAHYMHMHALLETSDDLARHLPRVLPIEAAPPVALPHDSNEPFDELMKRWTAVSFSMNALSRSLGHPDPYPFAISPAASEKMRFIHEVVNAHQMARTWA